MIEPLDQIRVKQLIREIIDVGTVTFSGHALSEMTKDDLLSVAWRERP